MIRFLLAFLSWFGAFFRSRHDLGLELVALRQQVGVLKRKNPRPRLRLCDRLFWLGLRRWWSEWASSLVIVKPETVVGWHRAGFRCYWRFLSRRHPGRPKITAELPISSDRWWPRIPLGALLYYHDDRIHDALKKETPILRAVERRPRGTAQVMGLPRVGGLHHRYH